MRARIVALTAVALLAGSAARADLKEGTYAPDIEAKEWLNTRELLGTETDGAISLSELRGMVVVLYFWVSYHKGGEYFMPLINVVENSERLGRRRGVFLMGVTEADRTRVEEMIKEERLFFPIALESSAAKEYDIQSFPRVVVIDPNGKIAFTGLFGREDANNFISKISDVIAETPPTRTHPREKVEAERLLESSRKLIRSGDYRAAYMAAREAWDRALTGDVLKTRCQDMIDLIEAIGRDQLAQGLALVEQKKFDQGVALLRNVQRAYRAMSSGHTAQKRLKSLEERYPEVKSVLERLQRENEARGLLLNVKQYLWDRDFGPAYDTCQKIIKDYSQTPAVPTAQTILRRMEKNQTVMGYVRDHQAGPECKNWLSQARSFMQQGNVTKARELLERIIKKYPETRWTEEAYRELEKL